MSINKKPLLALKYEVFCGNILKNKGGADYGA
jgi:hypothetical protein